MRKQQIISIGFGSYVLVDRVVLVSNPKSSPMRRLRDDAKDQGRLIDATQGRKTRSLIVTDSNHVILSGIQTETIQARIAAENVEE